MASLDWYRIKPVRKGLIGKNRLIFWQFRPYNFNCFDIFEEDVWTYFFPLFLHIVNGKNYLCPDNLKKYALEVSDKEIDLGIECHICNLANDHYKDLSKIKSSLSIDKALDDDSYDDLISSSKKYEKVKKKLLDHVVQVKYLFLVLDYDDHIKNVDKRGYEFKLSWAIGDPMLLESLQYINNTDYNLCNASSIFAFNIIIDTMKEKTKYFVFPDLKMAELSEEIKSQLNDSDEKLDIISEFPFVVKED